MSRDVVDPKNYPTANRSVKAQFDLSGRVAVVTGGAGFLGRQFCEALAEMGALPVMFDVGEPQAAATAVAGEFCRCEAETVDVTAEDSIRRATEAVLARHGRIDILINAAGLTKYGCDADPATFFAPFESSAQWVWDAGMKVNLTGLMLCCKVIGEVMVRQGKGSIVNVGSDIGVISPDQRIYEPDPSVGFAGVDFNSPAFYAVSKAGVIHLTRYLATIWAPKGVRVNSFSPAGVYRNHDEGFVRQLAARIPMGRMAVVDEYKGAICFLASDASSFMTGHNLVMDGGRTIW